MVINRHGFQPSFNDQSFVTSPSGVCLLKIDKSKGFVQISKIKPQVVGFRRIASDPLFGQIRNSVHFFINMIRENAIQRIQEALKILKFQISSTIWVISVPSAFELPNFFSSNSRMWSRSVINVTKVVHHNRNENVHEYIHRKYIPTNKKEVRHTLTPAVRVIEMSAITCRSFH